MTQQSRASNVSPLLSSPPRPVFLIFQFPLLLYPTRGYNPLFILPQFYGIQETPFPPPTRRSPSSFESDDDTPGKAGWCNNEYRRRDLPLIFIYVARISDRQPPSRHLLFFSLVAVLFPRVSTIVRGFSRPTMPIADCFVSDSK